MQSLLRQWANLNTGTFNVGGVQQLCHQVAEEFRGLGEEITFHQPAAFQSINARGDITETGLGPCLMVSRRLAAQRRVLLSIHLDTVYPVDSPFQQVRDLGNGRWNGPGVADAKGGLVVLLFALQALERFMAEHALNTLGWDVLLNSDEEIGSPGSAGLLAQLASQVQLGLLFEPALPDGQLISSRKGSGNFAFIVQGRAAHAGRDFASGRNAIAAASSLACDLHALNGNWPDVTVNVARIDGGGALNMVPDRAVVRLNVRYRDPQHGSEILHALNDLSQRERGTDITVTRAGDFTSPPKLLDDPTLTLLEQLRDCGQELGLDIRWSPSGGTCDGNRLAALGVPNVDSLGVRGGSIHSPDEFIELDSLVERSQLTALFLMRLAAGDIPGLSRPVPVA